jgi:hypothetical protein
MLATLGGEQRSASTSQLDADRGGVVEAALAALQGHLHFRGRANLFVMTAYEDVLVVRGAAPSYFLKQMLQSVLAQVEGVRRVDNQVAVVNPQGLSSVPQEAERPGRRLLARTTRRCLMKIA